MIDLAKKYILAVVGIVFVIFASTCVYIIVKSKSSKSDIPSGKKSTGIHTDINITPVKLVKPDKPVKPDELDQVLDSGKWGSTKKEIENNVSTNEPSTPKKGDGTVRILPKTPHGAGSSISDAYSTKTYSTPQKVGSSNRIPPQTPHSLVEKNRKLIYYNNYYFALY
ncbi:MAG: hypothetical protein IJI84_01770 [Clostridia bacterium]|nr:hypothetical protein [Clostridia bacterium]